MKRTKKCSSLLSFRMQLVFFGLLLVIIVALPTLFIEVQRPWSELNHLIGRGKIIVSQVKTDFNPYHLKKMNEFALKVNKEAEANPKNEKYLIWTFNLWFDFCASENCVLKLSPDYLLFNLKAKNLDTKDFDFKKVRQAEDFWDQQFNFDPKLRLLFKEYKEKLVQTQKAAKEAGFEFDDTYIMTDDGQKLVFLLDGSNWWESSYPGLEYDVIKNDCPYFRNYLKNGPGFDTNPIRYHLKIFPKFDTDQWGNWFSVWLAEKNNGIWNNFALDFEASYVKKLMLSIAAFFITAFLAITIVIILLTSQLSRLISKPIKNLVTGTEAVINNNYDYEVAQSGSREFEKLISFFNKMTKQLKERLNMKKTLEKLLSEELAEQVAKNGLVLGGQKVEITNLFTDFAGFSTITKNMNPEIVVKMLNDYYSALIPIIKKYGGFPDKFIGDAIVVIFGAPVYLPNHAELAVTCAIEMQLKLRQINTQRRKEGKPVFEMRIGLNSGEVIAGAIGSDLKLEYTSIGETTNLAQRMENSCQIGHILIAQRTFELVQNIFFDGVDFEQYPQQIEVKGYDQPVKAYNIFIDNSVIKKNIEKAETSEFYEISWTNHHIKFADNLTPEEKKKFNKIIKITPS